MYGKRANSIFEYKQSKYANAIFFEIGRKLKLWGWRCKIGEAFTSCGQLREIRSYHTDLSLSVKVKDG